MEIKFLTLLAVCMVGLPVCRALHRWIFHSFRGKWSAWKTHKSSIHPSMILEHNNIPLTLTTRPNRHYMPSPDVFCSQSCCDPCWYRLNSGQTPYQRSPVNNQKWALQNNPRSHKKKKEEKWSSDGSVQSTKGLCELQPWSRDKVALFISHKSFVCLFSCWVIKRDVT